jgi:RNase P/RNase MRP subunit p30
MNKNNNNFFNNETNNYVSDFIKPKNNESALINRCKILNFKEIVLFYDIKNIKDNYETIKDDKINIKHGTIINENISINKLRKLNSKDNIVTINYLKIYNNFKEIIENSKNVYVYNFEFLERIDYIHQRNSGLNHVLIKIMKENNIKPVFNFSEYIKEDNKTKSIILGRLKQNIKLFKKNKINYKIYSFANNTTEIKSSINSLILSLEKNK